MITHGNKQIREIVYARKASEGGGAVRLTNIIRGAQMVFGGLRPDVKMWLISATKAAILAAFGQTDGKAVIKATNSYLNALAATDPTKATALAVFINEDTMLVCSLGLQPQGVQMPIRELVGDATSYIDTGFSPTEATGFQIKYYTQAKHVGNWIHVFGCSSLGVVQSSNNAYTFLHGGNGNLTSLNSVINTWDILTSSKTACSTLTSSATIRGRNIASNATMQVFRCNGWSDPLTKSKFAYVNIMDNGEFVREMYPFIRKIDGVEKNGMIDIISGTFYPNANSSGSFTIEYTLPDGTPWTPLNQTP